jgi:large conductance mechanosensitive channel
VIDFLIIAFAIFLLIRQVNRMVEARKAPAAPAAPAEKPCPFCASNIPVKAIRCPHCTSDLKAA